jgi:hypothetical protein
MLARASQLVCCIVSLAAATQFVFVDDTITWTKNSYDAPPQLGPSNWTSPVDYVNGHVYARYHSLSKPSDLNTAVQLCMWQDSYNLESCSKCYNHTTEGIYYYDWGTPGTWWNKNPLDYTRQFQRIYLMHKDGSCSAKLLMTGACGAACYEGSDIDQHVPIRFHVKVIVVSAGGTLQPPSDWHCPWPECTAYPQISLGGSSMSFTMAQGTAPSTQYMRVTNSGTGTLQGITASVTYHDGSGWLEAAPASPDGNSLSVVTNIVDSMLAPGTYRATVNVSAANATSSESYEVTLTVSATPVITLEGTAARSPHPLLLRRTDMGRLAVDLPGSSAATVRLVDSNGRALWRADAAGTGRVVVPLERAATGVYFVRVSSGSRHVSQAVVIH